MATSPTTSKPRSVPPRPVTVRLSEAVSCGWREAGRLPRGSETKQHPDDECDRGAQGDDAHVESERHRRGKQVLWNDRGCDAQNRGADAHSQCAADDRQHQAFGEKLAHHPLPASAQRRPYRQFARAYRGACQQQVGDVRAADEQHEADHAEEQHRRQTEFAPDQRLVHRLDDDAAPFVRVGELPRQAVSHARHVVVCGLEAHAGLHPSDGLQRVDPSQGGTTVRGNERPDAGAAQQLKLFGHDADHGIRQSVQPDVATNHAGVGGKPRAPERFAQDDDIGTLAVVGGEERATGDRPNAEHVEKPGRDPLARHRLGSAVSAAHHHAANAGNEPGDHRELTIAIVPIEHVERRDHASCRGVAAFR